MDCRHEELHTVITKNPSEQDDKYKCLQCGKLGNIDDFPNTSFVETTMTLTKGQIEFLKTEPDPETGLKKLMRTGIKMQELRENYHDVEYVKSLIKNKKFPFEDGDIVAGLNIIKLAMLSDDKSEEYFDKD